MPNLKKLKNIIYDNKDMLIEKAQLIYKYKDEISKILKHIQWNDIRHGDIILTEEMLNYELKPIFHWFRRTQNKVQSKY